MKNKKAFLLTFVIILTGLWVSAQKKTAEDIKKMIESQNYVFKARDAFPMTGKSRQLTSEYDLTIAQNAVTAYLPYFGEAYTAPIDPTEGGIKFTSVDFEYSSTKNKKGWQVTIKPKDTRDAVQLFLTVFENGNANLEVTSARRQSISFSGYIK